MKKAKKIIKNNLKVLVGIIIGTMVTGTGVYAATVINASDVSYKNASSGMTSTNVQGAIEELYSDSKKNLDFIATVGTSYGPDVFQQLYGDNQYVTSKGCTTFFECFAMYDNTNAAMSSCTQSCVTKCGGGTGTPPDSDCMNSCKEECATSVYYKNSCKNLSLMYDTCDEKCSNISVCSEACLRKVVGSKGCVDYYLANK